MSFYESYLIDIENRKKQNLQPKPIDDGTLLKEVVAHIQDNNSPHR